MISKRTFAALGLFLILSPAHLYADCPAINSHSCCSGAITWKSYDFDLSCPSTSAGVGTSTGCSGDVHRVEYPTSLATIQYQYTIPQTSTGWEIRLDYEFEDGGVGTNYNRADYELYRNFSLVSSGNIYYTSGDVWCGYASVSPLSFQQGDILVVTIEMKTATSGSWGEVSNLLLFKVPA